MAAPGRQVQFCDAELGCGGNLCIAYGNSLSILIPWLVTLVLTVW